MDFVVGYVRGDGEGMKLKYDDYFKTADEVDENHSTCGLQRNVTSPYRIRHLFSQNTEKFGIHLTINTARHPRCRNRSLS